MVTSKNVGLAVPDWPTTFGYNMFLFPVSKWVGGILFEHTHRLIASAVGFLTIILAIWLWRSESRRWVRNLGLIALAGVILQGILGGLRVTMLKDEIGIFHACVAQAFLALLVLIALVTTTFWRSLDETDISPKKFAPIRSLAIAITLAIYTQLALGATMRHQHRDLSILDFPTANGAWIPDTSATALAKINYWRDARGLSDVDAFQIWLQMIHRLVALLIAIGVIAFSSRVWRDQRDVSALKKLSIWWIAFLVVQLTLGAWTIWSNKAADIATAHVAVGAIMLSFGVSISAICWRISKKALVGRDECQSGSDPGAPHSEPVAAMKDRRARSRKCETRIRAEEVHCRSLRVSQSAVDCACIADYCGRFLSRIRTVCRLCRIVSRRVWNSGRSCRGRPRSISGGNAKRTR
jgi:cytochrome c oxidase assembly protein subunit 15